MEKEFVPYDIALAMKELGFNKKCFTYYFEDGTFSDAVEEDEMAFCGDVRFLNHKNSYGELISAPLYQQAFRWFEDNYDDAITIRTYKMSNGVRWYDYSVNEFGGRSKSKEEAELTCLRKLIEIVKENL